jgi:pantoate--beta-alanine ligase
MGFLHEGHASLIRQSTARCDLTVVSVFVNPTQFGPTEDYAQYPRDLERDQALCLRLGASVLFIPDPAEVYPTGFATCIEPAPLADVLCGAFRPGHFRGVATVVAKLFNMVQPDLAFFGQKDLQQTSVIRRMVRDLNMPVDILVVPTVREADGLALSSRNIFLSPEERQRALAIPEALLVVEQAFQEGQTDPAQLTALAVSRIKHLDTVQYCELVDPHSLELLTSPIQGPAALCIAAIVGRTRLIDNTILSPSGQSPQFISHLLP